MRDDVYQIGDRLGAGTHPKIMDQMIEDGWLVLMEPCGDCGAVIGDKERHERFHAWLLDSFDMALGQTP